jgi:hypothetical protein
MTTFQLVAAGVFVTLLLVVYRKELLAFVRGRLKAGGSADADVQPSIAVTIVNDLISVTELRDKLAAENCPEGVDACTALLRVIVEHTKKKPLA